MTFKRGYGQPTNLGLGVFTAFWFAAGIALDAAWCVGQLWRKARGRRA